MAKSFRNQLERAKILERPIRMVYFVMLLLAIAFFIAGMCFSHTKVETPLSRDHVIELAPESTSVWGDMQSVIELKIPDAQASNMALSFPSLHCDIHIYDQDGNIIFALEAIPSIFGNTTGARQNYVAIPYGTTSVKVVVDEVFANSNRQLKFMYGDTAAMILTLVRQNTLSTIICAIIVVAGIVALGYWLMTHRRIRQNATLAYFGVLAILLGIWCWNETGFATLLLSNRTMGSVLGFTILLLIPIPAMMFTSMFFNIERPIVAHVLSAISMIVFFVLTMLHISGVMYYKESAIVTHLMLFVALSYMTGCLIYYIRHKGWDRRSVSNLIAIIIMILAGASDMMLFYNGHLQTDVVGKVGMLIYIVILSGGALTDTMKQVEEGRRAELYKEMAVTDIMTGLLNRSAFEQWEETCTKRNHLMLVTFDLNNLKWHNDTYGHAAGDEFITSAARIIREVFGPFGRCYRIGGDEFCAVINRGDRCDIRALLTRFSEAQEEYNMKSGMVHMQIAYGYAMHDPEQESIEQTRSRADEMMYENKKNLKETM